MAGLEREHCPPPRLPSPRPGWRRVSPRASPAGRLHAEGPGDPTASLHEHARPPPGALPHGCPLLPCPLPPSMLSHLTPGHSVQPTGLQKENAPFTAFTTFRGVNTPPGRVHGMSLQGWGGLAQDAAVSRAEGGRGEAACLFPSSGDVTPQSLC